MPNKTEMRLIRALATNRIGRPMDPAVTIAQMGASTFLATCGGRWAEVKDADGYTVGMLLLCGQGRAVEIVLNWMDYYTVRRVRYVNRGANAGAVVDESHAGNEVDAFQLSEVVYTAGCWK